MRDMAGLRGRIETGFFDHEELDRAVAYAQKRWSCDFGTGKRPLPEGTYFQLAALDSTGKVLAMKDASMVDSLKVGDSLYAGAIFRGREIEGLRALAGK